MLVIWASPYFMLHIYLYTVHTCIILKVQDKFHPLQSLQQLILRSIKHKTLRRILLNATHVIYAYLSNLQALKEWVLRMFTFVVIFSLIIFVQTILELFFMNQALCKSCIILIVTNVHLCTVKSSPTAKYLSALQQRVKLVAITQYVLSIYTISNKFSLFRNTFIYPDVACLKRLYNIFIIVVVY